MPSLRARTVAGLAAVVAAGAALAAHQAQARPALEALSSQILAVGASHCGALRAVHSFFNLRKEVAVAACMELVDRKQQLVGRVPRWVGPWAAGAAAERMQEACWQTVGRSPSM